MRIPLFKVFMSDTASTEVSRVLTSGFIGQGPKVEEFEKNLQDYFNNNRILTINSATSGIHLSLLLLTKPSDRHIYDGLGALISGWPGLNPGDTVLCSPLTCTATNWPVVLDGYRIKWVDIDPATLNMDLDDLARKITPQTKVIMLPFWGGMPVDMYKLKDIQDKAAAMYGFRPAVIIDAAHALDSKFDGKHICNFGHITIFSFQAIKHITSVDGGAVVLPHQDLYDRGKKLRWYGIRRDENRSDFRCLHPKTKIRFSDGYSEKISVVVNSQIDKDVLVFENGRFVPRKIKRFIKSERGDRYFVRVTTNRLQRSFFTFITNDHRLLTENGEWKRADEIDGDKILTSFKKPNELQMQVIIGSLLGDATITTKTKSAMGVFAESKCPEHEEYLKLKQKALSDFVSRVIHVKRNERHNLPNGKYFLYTYGSPAIGEIREHFYPSGHKCVPREIVSAFFSKRLLATWFMDDGCTYVRNSRAGLTYSSEIATNGFLEDDVQFLVDLLMSHGYDCKKLRHGKVTKKNKGFRIFFSKAGTKKLLTDVAPFVPTSMRYKVGHCSEFPSFEEGLWSLGHATGYFDTAIITPYLKGRYPENNVYCLEVYSQYSNFQSSAIVVHNCENDISEVGTKYHLNDVNATVGIENLKHIKEITRRHRDNAAYYTKELSGGDGIHLMTEGVKLLHHAPETDSSYWIYTILVERREQFMEHMKAHGIQVSRVHERNDKHSAVAQFRSQLPNLESIIDKMVCIPVHHGVSDEDRAFVVETIKKGW